jgi:hypothetical protein
MTVEELLEQAAGSGVWPNEESDRPRVLAQLSALKTAATPELRDQWRALSGTEPPPYNRRFLESRLAYRIQELAWGGLKPETVKRLDALADAVGSKSGRRKPAIARPVAGTRLIREWKGVEHCVTVRADGY